MSTGFIRRARIRTSVFLRALFRRPVRLCHPLDGFRGYFSKDYALKPPEVHYVHQVVERIRSHFVCFDVGAYLGYYTLLFARFAREVHAFEPLPANLRVLRANVRLNRLGNVSMHETAVSGGRGRTRLCASAGVDSMASVRRSEGLERIEVETISLDSFCAETAIWPDLIKIDVEGCECEVIQGMQGVLARKHPLVFLEVHTTYVPDDAIDAMFGSLRGMGYRIFSWLEDVEPGGHGFWRNRVEIARASDLKVGATLALPPGTE